MHLEASTEGAMVVKQPIDAMLVGSGNLTDAWLITDYLTWWVKQGCFTCSGTQEQESKCNKSGL